MKFIHLSDLHLGKRVNEFSMVEDQKYILEEILKIMDDEKPDGVFLAGDIYDKSVAPGEAVVMFDQFLCQLAQRNLQVFVIAGNHDSAERLSFGRRLMEGSGIHMAPVYRGEVEPVTMKDEYGKVNVYMLPFVKPVHVHRYFPDEEIKSYTDALRCAVKALGADESQRNVIVTHQFVTGASTSDSEEKSVGGSDNVDADVFDGFDYVALGHIHGPQNIGSERVRYCGTPLKYSLSEAGHKKSVTVVTLGEKGSLEVKAVPLKPLRDMAEIKGTYMELTAKSYYDSINRDNYLGVILTDEDEIPDAMAKLRMFYPNVMKLTYDNKRTRETREVTGAENVKAKSPLELFMEFYETQNNQPMREEQIKFTEELIEKIEEGR